MASLCSGSVLLQTKLNDSDSCETTLSQINVLKSTLQREKELKIEHRKRLDVSPVVSHELNTVSDIDTEDGDARYWHETEDGLDVDESGDAEASHSTSTVKQQITAMGNRITCLLLFLCQSQPRSSPEYAGTRFPSVTVLRAARGTLRSIWGAAIFDSNNKQSIWRIDRVAKF